MKLTKGEQTEKEIHECPETGDNLAPRFRSLQASECTALAMPIAIETAC
jgi:hypothetical protein